MTYDQFEPDGRHSTAGMTRSAAQAALAQGYRPEQILLGLPAYGRPLDGSARWPLYHEQTLGESEEVSGGASFNSAAMTREKTRFAREAGLGGVFLFPLTGDLPAGDPLSILGNAAGEGTR